MKRILGIDPGSRFTGYGIIELKAGRSIWVNSGCIRVKGDSLAEKLCIISEGLNTLLDEFQPDEMAIEKVFVSKNIDSALKLGQARGAAISTVALRKIPVSEYTPTQIKKAVVGKGNAAKTQVQHMVVNLLGLSRAPQEDAADALAIALCHAHTGQTLGNRIEALTKISTRTRVFRTR
ncbi:MAG: crossover junction endodeoxyribonuclease RuvC [Gammaproteobacteria bacterium]|nr:crossover junction endodeoxyribonuclease RuvC [Gammaproteobacteria bacterium]MCW8986642.1 crossover junction endodeoxyribonuclease RuvC [Gammaproteobacteria bacterium]MCW9030293.1 crossover junction endodeoxyribonuclease RuvC [Gammaproteobacteria bacterium]